MTWYPTNHWEVPKQTARVARTSLTEGNAPLELVGETLGAALNEIATLTPESFKTIISERWGGRLRQS